MRRRFVTITFVTIVILLAAAGSLGGQGRGRGGFGPGNPGHGNRVGGAGPVVRTPAGPRGTFFPSAPGPVFGQRVIARFQPIRPLPGFVFPQPYVTYSPYSVIVPPVYTAPAYVAPTYVAPGYD